jgi:ribosomal protein S18 acetylase RimI-like enzyme
MRYRVRAFSSADGAAVNALAIAAFEQFRDAYNDWPTFSKNIGSMASLSQSGELIVAESEEKDIVGAVGYIGPDKPKGAFFKPEWPIMRMLVVAPSARGFGIGRRLADECVQRAQRDQAPLLALHTTAIMTVALPMYERMGFKFHSEAPAIFGVPYSIYIKHLDA